LADLSQAVRILQLVKLFHGLDHAALATVARAAQVVHAKPATYFFRQGTSAETMYVLQHGRVRLSQTPPEGQAVLLRLIGPGQVFGPTATLRDRLYPVSAQAVSGCQALAWEGHTMVHLMEQYPRIALNTIEDLSAHIQELRERYLELATQRVERRVAHALLRLADKVGWRSHEGTMIDVSLSRQDLAEMTGTTLFTVSRTLRSWQRRGLVNAGRQRVTLLRLQELIAIAEDRPTKMRPGAPRARPRR
jgi:CRP-like cAMP-binding protein